MVKQVQTAFGINNMGTGRKKLTQTLPGWTGSFDDLPHYIKSGLQAYDDHGWSRQDQLEVDKVKYAKDTGVRQNSLKPWAKGMIYGTPATKQIRSIIVRYDGEIIEVDTKHLNILEDKIAEGIYYTMQFTQYFEEYGDRKTASSFIAGIGSLPKKLGDLVKQRFPECAKIETETISAYAKYTSSISLPDQVNFRMPSQRIYPDGTLIPIDLPPLYRHHNPSSVNSLGEPKKCETCRHINDSGQCTKWNNALVRPDYMCNKYKRTGNLPGGFGSL